MVTGPRNPLHPVGPPKEIARYWWGAVAKYQEFEDGYLYEFSIPMSGTKGVMPRPDAARILFLGRWLSAFSEDDVNYLSVWLSKEEHDRILPDGPPSFVYYDEENAAQNREIFESWAQVGTKAPATTTGEIKLVELARLVEAENGPEEP